MFARSLSCARSDGERSCSSSALDFPWVLLVSTLGSRREEHYLGQVSAHDWFKDMFTCFRIMYERVALGAVNNLEVLRAGLAKDGLWRHGEGFEGRE